MPRRARSSKVRAGTSQASPAASPEMLSAAPQGRASGARGSTASASAARSAGSASGPPRRRAEKSIARRDAILSAALDEFSAAGFAAARLDDVARRAGVAKGTIYLHFKDKEALFQELVRTMLGPLIAGFERMPAHDLPLRAVLERFAGQFVNEIYASRRRDVIRLVLTEGARFPNLAEFYYREVVSRAIAVIRQLVERAVARGEIRHPALAAFPQLIASPALVAIMWSSLFGAIAPLDVAGLMQAHIDILLGRDES